MRFFSWNFVVINELGKLADAWPKRGSGIFKFWMNTRADRGGTVLELKVEKLGKHETAWRKRRDVQTLAISNLSPPPPSFFPFFYGHWILFNETFLVFQVK